jgi:protein TonB
MVRRSLFAFLLVVLFSITLPAQQRIRVPARTQEIKLRKKVEPVYPPKAKAARIEGTVRLSVIIGKKGSVESAEVTEGPIELRRAALDAVEKYVYEPTTVNGELVEVISTVDVVFELEGSK